MEIDTLDLIGRVATAVVLGALIGLERSGVEPGRMRITRALRERPEVRLARWDTGS